MKRGELFLLKMWGSVRRQEKQDLRYGSTQQLLLNTSAISPINMKICVAVVSNRLLKPKTTLALMQMIAKTKHEIFPIVATEGYTTAEGRSYCVIQAQKENCSHILFIDDDMTFPEDTIERLLAHRKEFVGVYSYSRALPLSPTVS